MTNTDVLSASQRDGGLLFSRSAALDFENAARANLCVRAPMPPTEDHNLNVLITVGRCTKRQERSSPKLWQILGVRLLHRVVDRTRDRTGEPPRERGRGHQHRKANTEQHGSRGSNLVLDRGAALIHQLVLVVCQRLHMPLQGLDAGSVSLVSSWAAALRSPSCSSLSTLVNEST